MHQRGIERVKRKYETLKAMPCAWPYFYTQKAAQGSAKEKTKMIYYRVKPEKDNVPKRKKGSFAQDGIYIPKRNGASIARHIYTQRG